ncbi:MAG: PilZ domain-containing protein [Gammaproteobacteria bacterium]|nr:PilZ domain-containing protein [Gammaproteobacteria bacterium]
MYVSNDDNRFFARMDVECVVRYKVNGATDLFHGQLENLSAEGVSFNTTTELNQDTEILLEVNPGNSSIPPLMANAKVLRCAPSDEGKYRVCCEMKICA